MKFEIMLILKKINATSEFLMNKLKTLTKLNSEREYDIINLIPPTILVNLYCILFVCSLFCALKK